jgi:hypothetical protein
MAISTRGSVSSGVRLVLSTWEFKTCLHSFLQTTVIGVNIISFKNAVLTLGLMHVTIGNQAAALGGTL